MLTSPSQEGKAAVPNALYKYLSPERVEDVLQTRTLKFTPMANTNDLFEVRKTFGTMVGPRFQQWMSEAQDERLAKGAMEERLFEKFNDRFGQPPNRNNRRRAGAAINRRSVVSKMHRQVSVGLAEFYKYLNSGEATKQFLAMFGEETLCLSLSESYDISPMWAHYASNNSGFVIEFDAHHSWFRSRSGSGTNRLHKVHYIDGIANEIMDNPELAFGSKMTSWSYEKE